MKKISFVQKSISIKYIVNIVILVLIAITVLSITSSLAKYYWPKDIILDNLNQFFDSNLEANLPTLFSFLLIFINSIIIFIISLYEKEKYKIIFWRLLSILFFIASIDEIAQIHEKFDIIMRHYHLNCGFFTNGWVTFWAIIIIIFLIIFAKFLWSLPQKTQNQLIIAGLLYAFGALGFEIIGGYLFSDKLFFIFSTTIEEFLEMAAMIIFANTFLNYLKNLKSNFCFKLVK